MQPRSRDEREDRREEEAGPARGVPPPHGFLGARERGFTGSAGDEVERLAHAVIGAAIEVHRHLGPGFVESVYEVALRHELSIRGIPFEKQFTVPIDYKGVPVGEGRIDLLVGGLLVVELKACDGLGPIHRAQVISYLRATKLQLGLLINFNVESLHTGVKRVILMT